MPFRAVVDQVSQLGVETTEGTAVACNKRLLGVSFSIAEAAAFDEVQPSGMLVPTAAPIRQNWSTFSIDGYPDYNSLIYLFSGLFGAPTTTTPGGATLARQHVWTPPVSGISRKNYTLQMGDPNTTTEQVAGATMTDFSLGFSRTAAQTLDGSGFAKAPDYSASLTATPTDIAVVPILAGQVSAYLDNTGAGIGTTKLTGDFSAGWKIGGMRSPAWVLDASLPSYKESVTQRPDLTVSLELGNDATSRALITDMRAGTTKFLEIRCVGATNSIETGQAYTLKIQTAFQTNTAPAAGEIDGASTLPFAGRVVYDATWGKHTVITLINALTSL